MVTILISLLVGQLFEGESLCLWQKESRTDTCQHEESEDLQTRKRKYKGEERKEEKNIHVVDKLVGSTDILELHKADLGDNSTKLTTGSRDTVSSRSITSREDFSWDDEGGGVGTKVLEEVGEAVKDDESLGSSGGLG